MNKIALVTDSTCDLPLDEIKKFNIHILPLRIIYNEREYLDGVDITPEEVYENLNVEVPKTSLPSMSDIDNMFIKLQNEGYTHVIAICISSGLSGTFNCIKLSADHHPKIISHVFDSLALTMGAGAIVLECGKMIASGMDFEEIINKLPSIRDRIRVYYVLDTLVYLIKGGRIGRVMGTIGEFLNVKPIISINKQGVYYTYARVRGRNQSISKLLDIAKESLFKTKSKVWVLHGGSKDECKKLYEEISKLQNIISIKTGNIGPVAGVHTGPGLLGIVIMNEI